MAELRWARQVLLDAHPSLEDDYTSLVAALAQQLDQQDIAAAAATVAANDGGSEQRKQEHLRGLLQVLLCHSVSEACPQRVHYVSGIMALGPGEQEALKLVIEAHRLSSSAAGGPTPPQCESDDVDAGTKPQSP
jgi:hypothetical protein